MTDLHQAIFEGAPEAIIVVDAEGRIVASNAAAYRLLGYQAPDLIDALAEDLVPSDLRARHARHRATYAAAPLPRDMGQGRNLVAVRADGEEVAVDIALAPISWDPALTCVMLRDATARRRQEAHLERLADEDPLTRVRNRRSFQGMLEQHAALSRRTGDGLSVLILDLDGFKSLNDANGHQAGDEALMAVADLLRARLRSSDVVGRLGGDEFGIVLPGATVDRARVVAEEIRFAVEDTLGPTVTASIGVATYSPEDDTTAELVARADQALYRAKDDGRNLVR